MNKVLNNAQNYLENNEYDCWSNKKDGASLVSCMLFEEATDINFFVGKAINPAHQNPDLPWSLNLRIKIIDELTACLKKMGKRIKLSFF